MTISNKIKYIIILFTLASCINSTKAKPQEDILPINEFADIPISSLNSHSLILLDIDNTIYRSTKHYGSAEFFSHMVKEEVRMTNCTEAQAKLRVYDRWTKSQQRVKTKLIDQEIHDFIQRVKSNNATVIAFTARQPVIKDITINQLKKHKIYLDRLPNFSFAKIYKNQIFPSAEATLKEQRNHNREDKIYHYSQAIFYKGVLFAHDLNKKGLVFTDFFNTLTKYKPGVRDIVFVDDGRHNLESVAVAARRLGIKFIGYHIKTDFNFDPNLAALEEQIH